MEEKKLYRSEENAILAGVCGGIEEYFNVDPTFVRGIWILGTLITFFTGIIFYIILIFIIPVREQL